MGSLIHVLHLHVLALSASVILFAIFVFWCVGNWIGSNASQHSLCKLLINRKEAKPWSNSIKTRFRIINFIKYNPVSCAKKNKFCKSSLDQRKKCKDSQWNIEKYCFVFFLTCWNIYSNLKFLTKTLDRMEYYHSVIWGTQQAWTTQRPV